MAVQYHTHVFEIPTATPDDVAEGTSSEIAVTPESLAPTVETVRTAVQPYPSVADMAGIGIPASTDSLTVDGYQVAGDGGGALYAKVESEPSHAAKFQTADGAWWGLVDTIRIDARWLGVKANGIVDDRVAAQNAIDFASALGGGVVLFPRGTIMLGGVGLSVPSNVTIQGAGKGITIFKRIAGAAMHVISCQTFAENVQILDLTVDGNKQADPQGVMAGYHGIRGAGTKGLTIERVHVKNAIYYGIGLQGIENLEYDVRITDCDIEANGGWSTSSPTSGDGIDIKSANRVWLTRVRSWNNAQKGFDPRAYLLDITDCHAEGNGNAGFHLRGRGDLATNIKGVITVKGGSAVGNGVNGVVVSQDNPLLPLDVSITGFDAIGNTSQGIFINHELISASIVGSLVRDNTGAGVRSIAAEVTFTGNRLMNNGTYGFDGAAQNNRNIVSGNICLGNATENIRVPGGDLPIHNGNITDDPAGAYLYSRIIERGSNDNGEYVRFADGTQRCWKTAVHNASLGATTAADGAWTLPVSFVDDNYLVGTNCRNNTSAAGVRTAAQHFSASAVSDSSSSALWGIYNGGSTAATFRLDLFAEGRWR